MRARYCFPEKDERGIHRFDRDEVEALAYRLAQGEPLDTAATPWFEEQEQDREVEELRTELEQARAEVLRVNGENEQLRRQVRQMERDQDEVARTMMETSRLLDELL